MGVGWGKNDGCHREHGKVSSLGNECWIWKMPVVPGDSAFSVQHLNSLESLPGLLLPPVPSVSIVCFLPCVQCKPNSTALHPDHDPVLPPTIHQNCLSRTS